MPLRYVGIRVTNLARSVRFYTKVLGLKEVGRGDAMTAPESQKAGLGSWVVLEDPRTHQRIELNWYPPRSKFATPYVPGEGLDHLGFFLGKVSRRKLELEYHRLLSSGGRPTEVSPAVTDGWVAHVKDPDGNWVEIFRHPTAAEERAANRAKPRKGRRKR
ncbi:MAG: VOC family protein [Thermoplasmata archaeon]